MSPNRQGLKKVDIIGFVILFLVKIGRNIINVLVPKILLYVLFRWLTTLGTFNNS